jgi:hypothetical protein
MVRSFAPDQFAIRPITRRRLLAAGGGTATLLLAGCSEVLDFFGELVLEDVNVFNTTEHQVTGSIDVSNPDEATVLETSFEIPPDRESGNEDSVVTYSGVLSSAGTYTVSATLDAGPDIDGATTVRQAVEVTSPSEQHVVVGLGVENGTGDVFIEVIDEFSDLEERAVTTTDGPA